MPFWNNGNEKQAPETPPEPIASEGRPRVEAHMAERGARLQALTDEVERLIKSANDLIADDRRLAGYYSADVVGPWSRNVLGSHDALQDVVLTSANDLRAATELVAGGHTDLALQKHGGLLRQLSVMEQNLAALRRDKPLGIPSVSIVQCMRLQRRPTTRAQEILATLLPEDVQTALGEVQVQDVVSRLAFEGIDAASFTTRTPRPQYIWRDPRVVAALAASQVPQQVAVST